MKTIRYKFEQVLLLFILFMFLGCMSTNEVKSGEEGEQRDAARDAAIEIYDPSLRLADYLQRVGGVNIHESGGLTKVIIRGNFSFETNSEPLYVIDGVRSGHDYNRVERMIPVQSIYSVSILKGSEASAIYGLAGSNGAIVIRTK